MPLTAFKDVLGDKFEKANAVAKGLKKERDDAISARDKAAKEKTSVETKLATAESERDQARTDLDAAKKDDKAADLAKAQNERDKAREDLKAEKDAHEATRRNHAIQAFAEKNGFDAGAKYFALLDTEGLEVKGGEVVGDEAALKTKVEAWKSEHPRLFDGDGGGTKDKKTGGGPEPDGKSGAGGATEEETKRKEARALLDSLDSEPAAFRSKPANTAGA